MLFLKALAIEEEVTSFKLACERLRSLLGRVGGLPAAQMITWMIV